MILSKFNMSVRTFEMLRSLDSYGRVYHAK